MPTERHPRLGRAPEFCRSVIRSLNGPPESAGAPSGPRTDSSEGLRGYLLPGWLSRMGATTIRILDVALGSTEGSSSAWMSLEVLPEGDPRSRPPPCLCETTLLVLDAPHALLGGPSMAWMTPPPFSESHPKPGSPFGPSRRSIHGPDGSVEPAGERPGRTVDGGGRPLADRSCVGRTSGPRQARSLDLKVKNRGTAPAAPSELDAVSRFSPARPS